MISDDLVNSYHLLLCALDLVLTSALLCNARKELLNPTFKGTNLCTAASSCTGAVLDWRGTNRSHENLWEYYLLR